MPIQRGFIMNIYEIYVEKKPKFAQEAVSLAVDLHLGLKIDKISKIRILNRYFIEDISEKDFETAKYTIFSEPPVDNIYDSLPSFEDSKEKSCDKVHVFAVEFLPGQFDQRADSCAQCISLATGKERPKINTAKIYVIYGDIENCDLEKIKSWIINPVESREASMVKPKTLTQNYPKPNDVASVNGFITFCDDGLKNLQKDMNLAMDLSDMKFCQEYFRNEEKRDPTITEIKVLDTYWSDHCRHTTFLTELNEVKIDDEIIKKSYENYLALRRETGRDKKPVTLMDMATIGTKALKQNGLLPNLDESQEINACSVKIKVDVNGKDKDYLLMFKNETHNHPTEIEPFGGAATCLGGAIRDPLSGRAYVYQAMRVTGAGNPLQNISDTIPGKLSQLKICRTAAAGYSSYGNQIGLPAGHIYEIYHQGYTAKRMELGAVIGAAPAENVIRKVPQSGDVVILLGGRTGRDGIGGATGSSKSHDLSSIEACGTDVQRGNAPEEHKIQRLFRNPKATRLIKRCNDFGAGGVSVSVGELADGLLIDLDFVTKKYEGLDGTELAISESQERMSIVVAKKDVKKFISLAKEENLEATVIANVTKEQRLVMKWQGKTIVNLCRKFLNTNGAAKFSKAHILNSKNTVSASDKKYLNENEFKDFVASLNMCSQKGLVERFDSTIGNATAVALFGGKYQLTPAQVMAAKIPVLNGDTNTCSLMSWGFDPEISSESTYFGAMYAVVHSLAKIIASGGSRKNTYLSFQEYFERLRDDPVRWGKPAAALLGALEAQMGLYIAAIGGKDSMSGSYTLNNGEEINVPPTLVSFAVSTVNIQNIITPEFKKAGSKVYLLKPPVFTENYFSALREYFDNAEKLIKGGKVLSVWAVGTGGTCEAVFKMCVGNRLGFCAEDELSLGDGFGGFVVEVDRQKISHGDTDLEPKVRQSAQSWEEGLPGAILLGLTTKEYVLKTKSFEISMEKLQSLWENTLEPVYPRILKQEGKTENFYYDKGVSIKAKKNVSNPKFLIPLFPGTNCEYDSARAIEKAGAAAEVFIIKNLTSSDIKESVIEFTKAVKRSNVIFFPGGFSGGDEPDGSGKFITSFIRNPHISDAVMDLIKNKDGLICGVCNGFQALFKLGLVPYGEIKEMTVNSPTLTINSIGRHQSMFVNTKIVSNKSPWLCHLELGSQYIVPISHGEGRFIGEEEIIQSLAANGQIATQYVDFNGNASQDINFNPNNSDYAIEGITSPDGRVFGKMAHNERFESGLYKNIPNIRKMDIFSGAVRYFKG